MFGTSVLDPGAGFLRIFTVAFDRLFQVRLGQLNVNNCPAGLEPPRRGQKEEKSYCEKKQETRPLAIKHLIRFFFLFSSFLTFNSFATLARNRSCSPFNILAKNPHSYEIMTCNSKHENTLIINLSVLEMKSFSKYLKLSGKTRGWIKYRQYFLHQLFSYGFQYDNNSISKIIKLCSSKATV